MHRSYVCNSDWRRKYLTTAFSPQNNEVARRTIMTDFTLRYYKYTTSFNTTYTNTELNTFEVSTDVVEAIEKGIRSISSKLEKLYHNDGVHRILRPSLYRIWIFFSTKNE